VAALIVLGSGIKLTLWTIALLIRLLNDQAAQGYDLSFVEQFNTGAAPLSAEVVTQLGDRFPNVRIRQSWGMTETTSCLTTTPPGFMMWNHAVKVGKLVPGTAVRVVDPATGKDVPRGQTGEVSISDLRRRQGLVLIIISFGPKDPKSLWAT
jgi:4-coumarate--CoA ligase